MMSGVFEYECEAVRVRARRGSGEWRKFSIDPNLTSREVLLSLLARAFDMEEESDLVIHFYTANQWMPLHSDWDLDVAILTAADPFLSLSIDKRSGSNKSSSKDAQNGAEIMLKSGTATSNDTSSQFPRSKEDVGEKSPASFSSLIRRHVERTLVPRVSRALGLSAYDASQNELVTEVKRELGSPRKSLDEESLKAYTNRVGQLTKPREMRLHVYLGGCEHNMRKVVWKHLLGVYPSEPSVSSEGSEMSGRDRVAFMRSRCGEYEGLKRAWLDSVLSNCVTDDLKHIMHMVKKDVRRTDRHLSAFTNDQNVGVMYNILTTFAVHHPSVGYSQGMSDLLSPLVVVMGDEAQSYVAFCALMHRLKANFRVDGVEMNTKFQHLAQTILHYDPEFFAFLKSRGADDLIFCYRWLLLELKREFPFEDALTALEVLWASLPPARRPSGVLLAEKGRVRPEVAKGSLLGNVVAMRKRISSSGDAQVRADNKQLHKAASDAGAESRARLRSAEEEANGNKASRLQQSGPEERSAGSPRRVRNFSEFYAMASKETPNSEETKSDEDEDETFLPKDETNVLNMSRLPPPTELGDGNPFLMFMCLALILQQRDAIMEQQLDYQEVAMYFDRMMRKHDVHATLALARKLFADYLNGDWRGQQPREDSKHC